MRIMTAVSPQVWWEVVYVRSDGWALAVANGYRWFEPGNIEHCTLDLASVWEGRKYTLKGGDTGDCDVILFVGGDIVAFGALDRAWNHVWDRRAFLDRYEPVPLEPPAKAAEAKPAWKPEVGKECLYNQLGYSVRRVFVRAIDEDNAWVRDASREPASRGFIASLEDNAWVRDASREPASRGFIASLYELSPLSAPEPPVHVGEDVKVSLSRTQAYYGVVVEVCKWPTFTIKWATGRDGHMINLTFGPGVTITKLVAAPQTEKSQQS